MKKLRITLMRSQNGWKPDQVSTLKGLGLKKIGQAVIREDNPSVRGMVNKVRHLVSVEEIDG
ncbi:MAG: 50S ribosomal protein L30 [Caldimicrobium sp.]|nr:50S ribosomal protein L30 [Caldimicrobium sp.]MCX7613848.1 50S ribosomal protein L30 [Caldimicrobium sp.]MDW8182753.1 50S ribosomal protein L30 [Caldimicrobium sp.]